MLILGIIFIFLFIVGSASIPIVSEKINAVFNDDKKIITSAIVYSLFVFSFIVIGTYFIAESDNIYKEPEIIEIEEEEMMTIEEQLNFADSVYNYILFLNIKHPEVVMRQAQIESGNFTSKVFRENNNMFGMRIPFKRPNLVTGERRGYAVYDDWQSSIVDYALYQIWSGKGLNKEEYIKMLGRSYAEDINYESKIK